MDLRAALPYALHLLVEQVVGFPTLFVQDVGLDLRRYSRISVAGQRFQHVDDVQVGACAGREVRGDEGSQRRVLGAVGS